MTVDISFFLPSLEIGGAEKVIINLANEFSRRDYQIEIVVIENTGELKKDINNKIVVKEISKYNVPGYSALGSIPRLINYLHQTEPTWLYSAMNHINIPTIVAWKAANVSTKLMISEHNSPSSLIENSIKDRIVYFGARFIYPWADEIVAVSNGVKQGLVDKVQINPDNIHRIYNPIVSQELTNMSKREPDHPWFQSDSLEVILNVANMRPQKRLDDLVTAFSNTDNNNYRLVLIGDGPEREKIEKKVQDLGIEHKVEFLGFVENPYKYMNSASVFVLSSGWEGFGNVLVEAMACGCPVISTDCASGPSEILADGIYGTLVPVGKPNEIANAISQTLSDHSSDGEVNIRNRASEFHVSTIVSEYESVLGL